MDLDTEEHFGMNKPAIEDFCIFTLIYLFSIVIGVTENNSC